MCASPFPQHLIKDALFRLRGDMVSGEIKKVKVLDSVKAELPLLVMEDDAPDLYKMAEDDIVEIGPFAVSLSLCDLRDSLGALVPVPELVQRDSATDLKRAEGGSLETWPCVRQRPFIACKPFCGVPLLVSISCSFHSTAVPF